MTPTCVICGSDEWTERYAGPIRMGAFGSERPGVVCSCGRCGVGRLDSASALSAESYEDSRYRDLLDQEADACGYAEVHDAEQPEKLAFVGAKGLRGAVVADIGCAGGSFLDLLSGLAGVTIGIDPAPFYHESLRERGHLTFSSIEDALTEWRGRCDVVTGFAVVEHLEDPVALLSGARELLKDGSRLILSTPNASDALLSVSAEYTSFFYRSQHVHYFDERSLGQALSAAGFSDPAFTYRQRFGLGNAIGWLRDKRPTGDAELPFVTPAMDAAWKAELERTAQSDFLYAEAVR